MPPRIVLVEARYMSNPARLVITRESGPFACSNFQSNVTAVYDWTFDGSELTVTPFTTPVSHAESCSPPTRCSCSHTRTESACGRR